MSDCIFCQIAQGKFVTEFVHQDEQFVAFNDIHPQAPTHILIIPRAHFPTLNEVEDEQLLGRLLKTAKDLAKKMGVADSGYRTIINSNHDGGQTVYHLHLHLLAGRHLHWPPG